MNFESYDKILDSTQKHEIRLKEFFILKQQHSTKAFNRNFFSPGHYTASAVVVDHNLEKILLTHHKKLNLWLQLGGHADGDTNLFRVACKEMIEESGLRPKSTFFWNEDFFATNTDASILEVDVHEIPPYKSEPEHVHFDARFLFFVDHQKEKISISDESHDLKWFDWDEVPQISKDRAVLHLIAKLKEIKENPSTWVKKDFDLERLFDVRE